MARAFAAIAVATAFHILGVLHGASAARPMGWQAAASSGTATSALALAPAGHPNRQRRAEPAAAARAEKWLPFAGVHHHLPTAAFWAHRPVPWVGAGELGGVGAVEGGDGEELVRERDRDRERRQRPSYEGDAGGTTTTRQEQLAMWASLLNPKGKGRGTATGWMPAPGAGEVADDEPAKAADAVEGGEVDDTAAVDGARVGQTYWGNNGN